MHCVILPQFMQIKKWSEFQKILTLVKFALFCNDKVVSVSSVSLLPVDVLTSFT